MKRVAYSVETKYKSEMKAQDFQQKKLWKN